MKRLLFILLVALSSLSARAQIAEAWISMPDSLCPFLSEQHRLQMLQYAKAGLTDTIGNLFDGRSYIDSINLDANYISIQVTPNMTMTIRMTNEMAGAHVVTPLVCIEETVCAPICSTITSWYDASWTMVGRKHHPWSIEQTEEDKVQHF